MAQKKKTTEENAANKPVGEPTLRSLSSDLLWGGMFLLAGVLLLLGSLGVINIYLSEIWRLWPIIIIMVGLSILSLRGWAAVAVYGVSALVIGALVFVTLTGALKNDDDISRETFNITSESDDIQNMALSIEAGAGSINVSSADSGTMAEGESRGSNTQLRTNVTTDGETQKVRLSQRRDGGWMGPGSFSNLDIRLNKDLPTDLEIDAGASSINADLSDIKLRSLLVDSGASSIDLKLGDKLDNSEITIDTGASSVSVRVPRDSGIKLVLDAGLSSRDLPSDYEKLDDKTYQSSNYDDADKKITINVDMGISSFKLSTY